MEFLKEQQVTVSTSQTPFEESWLHLAGLWDLTNGDLNARWLYPFYLVLDDNDNMMVKGGDKLTSFFQIIWMIKKTNALEPDCAWWSGTYIWPKLNLSEDEEDEEDEEGEEGELGFKG